MYGACIDIGLVGFRWDLIPLSQQHGLDNGQFPLPEPVP